MDFKKFSFLHVSTFETTLIEYVKSLDAPPSLKESMLYSLNAGGKRIRPMLVMAVLDAYGKDPFHGLGAACAVEMIHTYSLIHDDLPCMDNDDMRRGKPTNHIVFGEGLATLAGDALQPAAFHIIADNLNYTNEQKIALISELAQASGATGMVGGQVADIEAEGQQVSVRLLEKIHEMKTGKLIEFSVVAGAILSGASQIDIAYLRTFAKHLGISFQIRDDILDIEGDQELIGKPVGSDQKNQKSTYPSLLTMNGAKEMLAEQVAKAKDSLAFVKCKPDMLIEIIEMIASRKN
ncbi:MAG: farnesyl-diphosphate synthase [Bacillales bacterium]|jgi:geranylgeranyl diphosphate synthase type II|nr:farnesyl-diphosphate synthase [Bacillales bacterium]